MKETTTDQESLILPPNLNIEQALKYEGALKYMIANGGELNFINFGEALNLNGPEWGKLCEWFKENTKQTADWFFVKDYFVVERKDGYDSINYKRDINGKRT